jgi:hypothetical protein
MLKGVKYGFGIICRLCVDKLIASEFSERRDFCPTIKSPELMVYTIVSSRIESANGRKAQSKTQLGTLGFDLEKPKSWGPVSRTGFFFELNRSRGS